MYVGIDIEQFVRDPYGSGIQRVLQYLAREWPSDEIQADFVVPVAGGHGLMSPQQAAQVLEIPFAPRNSDDDLRELVLAKIDELQPTRVKAGDLLSIFDTWLLPEVSYLPAVLERFELFGRCMPTAMIGYDTLPMSEPANYRFKPGTSAWVSGYFRHLATADAVVCISDFARNAILSRLRRDPALMTTVAHPGGDHIPIDPDSGLRGPHKPRFVRLGTMEARKRPQEILAAFRQAVHQGLEAELVFVGGPNASDEAINEDIRAGVGEGIGVSWIQGAGDHEVQERVAGASAFLSIGVEGYGIPVLEAIRLGTPVLYDGIQPAAELMDGRGSRRIDASSTSTLAAAFHAYASGSGLAELTGSVDPQAVPTWRDFALAVAHSTVG